MQTKMILVSLSLLVTFAAGCSQTSLRDDFGKSTAINRELQVVNPSAEYMEAPETTLDGQKAEKVIKDYRKEGAVAPTEVMTQ